MSELLSALIGALFGFFASLLTLRFYYRQLFAETVSKNRMDWINVWRENLAEFLSVATVLHAGCQNSSCSNQNGQCNLCDLKKEMMKAQIMITSRLNLTEEAHRLMLAAIKNFNYSSNNQNFTAQCEYIEELAREILKPEWERVKAEARGKNKLRRSKKMSSENKVAEGNKDSKCKYTGYLVTFIVVEIITLVALAFFSCKIHSYDVNHCCNVNYCILIAIAAVAITALICQTVILRTLILVDAKSEKEDNTVNILKETFEYAFNTKKNPEKPNEKTKNKS